MRKRILKETTGEFLKGINGCYYVLPSVIKKRKEVTNSIQLLLCTWSNKEIGYSAVVSNENKRLWIFITKGMSSFNPLTLKDTYSIYEVLIIDEGEDKGGITKRSIVKRGVNYPYYYTENREG